MTTLSLVTPEAASRPENSSKEGTWAGGFWREGAKGRAWFVRQRVGSGARVTKSLGVLDPDPKVAENRAMAEWALFRNDPAGYQTPKERTAELHVDRSDVVRLDPETMAQFIAYANASVERGELSDGYVKHTLAPYLAAWGVALGNRDLHKVKLDDLQKALRHTDWQRAQHKRVVALKAFTAWARTEKAAPKLRRGEDPTLDLQTPEVVPEKSRRKKGYSIEFVEKIYRELPSQLARDTLRLRACANGIHDQEIGRLARGEGELRVIDDPSGIYGVLDFEQKKKGEEHSVSVDRATFEAAKRLQARGTPLSRAAFRTMLQRVAIRWHGCGGVTKKRINKRGEPVWETSPCKGCQKIWPSELRHSFATWASNDGKVVRLKRGRGVPLELVAEAMGHKNKRTTVGFYRGKYVPLMIQVPLRLRHPEDPAID